MTLWNVAKYSAFWWEIASCSPPARPLGWRKFVTTCQDSTAVVISKQLLMHAIYSVKHHWKVLCVLKSPLFLTKTKRIFLHKKYASFRLWRVLWTYIYSIGLWKCIPGVTKSWLRLRTHDYFFCAQLSHYEPIIAILWMQVSKNWNYPAN